MKQTTRAEIDKAIKSSSEIYIPQKLNWSMDHMAYAAKILSTRGMILYMRLVKETPGSKVDLSFYALSKLMTITPDEWYDGFCDLIQKYFIMIGDDNKLSLRVDPQKTARRAIKERKKQMNRQASTPSGASTRDAVGNQTAIETKTCWQASASDSRILSWEDL